MRTATHTLHDTNPGPYLCQSESSYTTVGASAVFGAPPVVVASEGAELPALEDDGGEAPVVLCVS